MVQRRGYAEWVKLVEEFEKSASSLEDFAAKLGVKPSTLQLWFYKLSVWSGIDFECLPGRQFDRIAHLLECRACLRS